MGSASELAQCGFNWVRREKERERRFVKRNNFFLDVNENRNY